MPTILDLWLEEVPEYTSMFCISILIANQIDLMTLNLNTTNQAIGNVKVYSICINTIKILTLPVMLLILKMGMKPMDVMIVYIIFETICAITRVIFLHLSVNLSIKQYLQNVFVLILFPLLLNIIICNIVSCYLTGWLFLITGVISVFVTCISTYFCGLKKDEHEIIKNMFNVVINKIKR